MSKLEFDFVDGSEYERRKKKVIDNLTEDQKTDIIWNNEPLYLIGRGHDFFRGFFNHFITKSGIELKKFIRRGEWVIDGEKDNYTYTNTEWVRIVREPIKTKPLGSFDSVQLPKVKRVFPGTISSEITPATPKKKDE